MFLDLKDIWSGLVKAAVFGLLLTLTGCVKGYYTRGGAEGVGRATTSAVVTGAIAFSAQETLGNDAIILSNRAIPGGVEIMAVAAGDMDLLVPMSARVAGFDFTTLCLRILEGARLG